MIDHIIVRSKTNRAIIGLVDNFASIIWESVYFGVGTFEIYAPATEQNINMLRLENYVTRNERPRDVGIIESIAVNFDVTGALMITATGRFAKSILDRRLVYNAHVVPGYQRIYKLTPIVFSGKVETVVRSAVNQSVINPTDTARKIDFVKLGALQNLPAYIINADGSSQTTYGNLLELTDGWLQDCNYSAYMSLDNDGNLNYNVFEGQDKSATVRFSQDFDNLIKSNYQKNEQPLKTFAMVGGEGEGAARYYAGFNPDNTQTGIDRREIFVDASSITRQTPESTEDNPQYYDMGSYGNMLLTQGQTDLKQNHIIVETYNGEIDITANNYVLGIDYNVGDIVFLIDKVLNKSQKQRIYKATEVQDENGYNVSVSFDNNNN